MKIQEVDLELIAFDKSDIIATSVDDEDVNIDHTQKHGHRNMA